MESAFGETHKRTVIAIKQLVNLYTTWNESEPDKGYDAKAEQWRAKLSVDANDD